MKLSSSQPHSTLLGSVPGRELTDEETLALGELLGSAWRTDPALVRPPSGPSFATSFQSYGRLLTPEECMMLGVAPGSYWAGSRTLPALVSLPQLTSADLHRRFPARALTPEECAAMGVPPGSELGPPQLLPYNHYSQPGPPPVLLSMPNHSTILADLHRRFPARALTPEECRSLGVAAGSVLGPPQLVSVAPPGFQVTHAAPSFSHLGAGILHGEPGRPLTDGEAITLGVAPGSVWGSIPTIVTTVTQTQVRIIECP